MLPSETLKVRNCAEHSVLWWQLTRGALPTYLAQLLAQNLEQASPQTAASMHAVPTRRGAGGLREQSRFCFDSGTAIRMTIKPGRKT